MCTYDSKISPKIVPGLIKTCNKNTLLEKMAPGKKFFDIKKLRSVYEQSFSTHRGMDEDDGFLTSDAELDSEVEDNDESELSVWLDHLNTIQQVSGLTVSIYHT